MFETLWDEDKALKQIRASEGKDSDKIPEFDFNLDVMHQKIDLLFSEKNRTHMNLKSYKVVENKDGETEFDDPTASKLLKQNNFQPSTDQTSEKEDSVEKLKNYSFHADYEEEKEKKQKSLTPEPKFFGWEKLGKRFIYFDEEFSEYIYKVEEPKLSSNEIKLKNDLLHLFQLESDIDVSEMTDQEKKDHLNDLLNYLIKKHKMKISEQSKNNIFYYLFREFIGFSNIDILMNDDEIEDISCDGPDVPIFIYHRKYESIRTNIYFSDKNQLDSFAIKLAQLCGKQLSIYEPIVDGKLPDGSRLQTTLAKTVTNSSTFTIRRFREDPLTPVDLINYKTMSLEMVAYYWLAMEHGTSMLFCGGTASGKTTLLNALSLFLPSSFKIVSVEDTREINLPHENWIAGTTRQGFSTASEEKTSKDIDMFDLIRAALRQRPRVIIVGEVRGKEAYTLFQAMATGHLSYSTMHASDINTLIQRLENPPISLPRTLMTSLDIVTFLTTFQQSDGSLERRVNSVTEIIKQDPESKRLISVTPFSWNSAINDRFTYSGGSKILQTIAEKRGWNDQQLHDELEKRQEVLQWMVEHDIRSYKKVGSIVALYKKNPEQVFNKIKQGAL
jgi:flagellar protein FlaI